MQWRRSRCREDSIQPFVAAVGIGLPIAASPRKVIDFLCRRGQVYCRMTCGMGIMIVHKELGASCELCPALNLEYQNTAKQHLPSDIFGCACLQMFLFPLHKRL
ncbi:unnamed protein product [Amoebophrya sp. A25]|nr:unnamed protein product [Amoebophrya sp. A25]|eukprot:GSA25T00022569001.1